MLIEVTQEDIDEGMPADGQRCPVALAIKRTLKIDNVLVGPWHIWIGDSDCYITDPKVNAFIDLFDRCADGTSPITFKLKLRKRIRRTDD